jgi:sugar/nucleoside kinase (ribokinase family)
MARQAAVAGMRAENALRLAAWVAAAKCRQLGPRPGLPRREEVPPQLLEP